MERFVVNNLTQVCWKLGNILTYHLQHCLYSRFAVEIWRTSCSFPRNAKRIKARKQYLSCSLFMRVFPLSCSASLLLFLSLSLSPFLFIVSQPWIITPVVQWYIQNINKHSCCSFCLWRVLLTTPNLAKTQTEKYAPITPRMTTCGS